MYAVTTLPRLLLSLLLLWCGDKLVVLGLWLSEDICEHYNDRKEP